MGYIVFTTLRAQVGAIRRKGQESADNARGGKEDVSDFGKYSIIEKRQADFSIDNQISNREQETKREGRSDLTDWAILWPPSYAFKGPNLYGRNAQTRRPVKRKGPANRATFRNLPRPRENRTWAAIASSEKLMAMAQSVTRRQLHTIMRR